jgi:lipopolysaccharide biosynthesis glycosyltransferase
VPFAVITLADDRYVIPLAVMVRSLLEHWRSPKDLDLIVIDGGITQIHRERLELSWQDTPAWRRTTVRFVLPEYGTARLPVWGRIPLLTYSRICLAEYTEAHHTRAIFLDSDMLLQADVATLADTPLLGKTIAAAQDPFIPTVSSIAALANYQDYGLHPDLPYFNAGLLVADLERWRHQRVAERTFEHIQNFGHLLHHYDQDALNAILARDWATLDPGWQTNPRAANALGHTPEQAYLYHFSGALKPWVHRLNSPVDQLFYATLDRTHWKGWRPEPSWTSLALRLYDSPLRRLLHPIERRYQNWSRTRQRQR